MNKITAVLMTLREINVTGFLWKRWTALRRNSGK